MAHPSFFFPPVDIPEDPPVSEVLKEDDLSPAPKRTKLPKTDLEVGASILMALACSKRVAFAPLGFYDVDAEVMDALQKRLDPNFQVRSSSFRNRIVRVCNLLTSSGVLYSEVVNTRKYYLGEPRQQKEWGFAKPSYGMRLCPALYQHYTPDAGFTRTFELGYLLKRAFYTEYNNNEEGFDVVIQSAIDFGN